MLSAVVAKAGRKHLCTTTAVAKLRSMSDERDRLIERVFAAEDVLDILTATLLVCRAHPDELADMIQSRSAEMARRVAQVGALLPSVAVDDERKRLLADRLAAAASYVEEARIIAVAIDLMVRSAGEGRYGALCAALPIRTLEAGDPVPTPAFDLKDVFGNQRFSSRPRPSITAVDQVPGLRLWPASGFGFLKAIYDPVAGAALDAAMGTVVDMLVVAPNKDFPSEFTIGSQSGDGFFGVAVKDVAGQNLILNDGLAHCATEKIGMLVLPELCATEDFEATICGALSSGDSDDGWPAMVVGGSRHLADGDRRVNRLSVVYRLPRRRRTVHHDQAVDEVETIHHDKVARFILGPPEVPTPQGPALNTAGEENIHRSNTIRIHAGAQWSMIPLICADFLDRDVVQAVATLHPRLVIVSAMSQKTSGFVLSADTVIAACQSTVAIANGPAQWTAPEGTAESSDVAVFVLPLEDPADGTVRIRIRPAPDAEAPYRVRFTSMSPTTAALLD